MKLTHKTYEIHYEVHGKGRPIIILNGIMMSTQSWHMFLEDLTMYQVILLDFIDQGQSSCGIDYGHDDQVEVIKAVVDHLGLDQINLVGISYGAQIGLQYAIKYPVKDLMICNAALYTSSWLSDIGRAWVLAAEKNDPELFYHVTIPYIYSHGFYNKNASWMKERKDSLLGVFTKDFLERMIRLINSSEGYDIRDHVKKIACHTRVIASEFDYLTPADETKAIAQAIGCDYKVLKGLGHASMYESPQDFIALIKEHFVN